MATESKWRLVTYPNGIKQIEWFDEAEADVKSRATGNPVVTMAVMTQQEFDQKIAEATSAGYSEGYEVAKSIWCEI